MTAGRAVTRSCRSFMVWDRLTATTIRHPSTAVTTLLVYSLQTGALVTGPTETQRLAVKAVLPAVLRADHQVEEGAHITQQRQHLCQAQVLQVECRSHG